MQSRFDFVFSYWIFVWSLLYNNKLVSYNPKFALIIALIANIIKLFTMIYYKNSFIYIVLFILLGLLYYMYKTQQYIYDRDYLNEMIEHHSMALTTSGEILKKTSDPKVKILASKIINTQEEEIQYMKSLLDK